MKIGLRTIKTAISATLALLVANLFQLANPTAAAIIALLSVTNSKRSSVATGISRFLSLTLATIIAGGCFLIIGFTPLAFGVYLLLFIPATVYFKLSEGISVSSVLVTHYLIQKEITWQLIANEYALMALGVGFALLVNSYMPNREKTIKENQLIIESLFRKVLEEMADFLENPAMENSLLKNCGDIRSFITTSQKQAQIQMENQILQPNSYFLEYFAMRRQQANLLKDMIVLLENTTIEPLQSKQIRDLLLFTADNLAEANDGSQLLAKVQEVYDSYREIALPTDRQEFENRARLFQLLQVFENFIEIKADFAQELSAKPSA